jgi:hypothetical protein
MARLVSLDTFQQMAAINVLTDPGAIAGPIVVPSCTQVILRWALTDGKIGHCVLYGRFTGTFGLTQASANTLHNTLTTGGPWSALAPFIAPTASLAGVSFRNVDVPNQALIDSNTAAVPGTSTGTALPDENAVAVTLRTALTGPSFRGRYYVPGWATNAVGAGNVVAAAAVTALGNWSVNTVGPAISQAGLVWVLGLQERAAYTSPLTGRVFPHRAATSVNITSSVVKDNHWDSQRKRGLK